jgi:hypothetical protein
MTRPTGTHHDACLHTVFYSRLPRPLLRVLCAVSAALLLLHTAPAGSAQTLDGSGGGARNVVIARGVADGAIEVSGSVQLNRVPAPRVAPVNMALATASCTDCQTLAVALQIDLIPRDASWIVPENSASAVNYECTRCYTVARATQYVLQVDDPTTVPPDVAALARELDLELVALQSRGAASIAEAEARIDAVLGRFTSLAASLADQRVVAA